MSTRAPNLGVHLLETITRGMYSEPLHSVREYVQNGYDSIRAARRQGIIAPDDGTVRITIDRTARRLRIRDDGTGLSPEAAAVHLLDIGSSEKARTNTESQHNAGFRGIGRMAGISYCKTLRFTTSDGHGRVCTVEFDATAINRLTRPGQEPATIVHAIEANSRIDDEPAETDHRYLEVTLEGVDSDGPFMDEMRLAEYLGSVAPVRFDGTVWSFGEKIRSFAQDAESRSSLDTISAFICDADGNVQRDIRRPFKNVFRTRDGNRKRPRNVQVTDVVPLPGGGPINGWWGWLAVHERRGALADVPFAGLRIRVHNIAIGEEHIVRSLFKTQAHGMWCFGEIHVTHPALVPNAQRDDFEPSDDWDRIKAQIREEAGLIDREIRAESEQRNASVPTLARRADKKVKKAEAALKAGVASRYQQDTILRALQTEADKLDKQESRTGRTDDEREQLSNLRRNVEQAITSVREVQRTSADAAISHLRRDARQVFRTIMDVLKSELDDAIFHRVEMKIHAALQPGRKE